ncbi:MAG TPA: hypothetical protein VGB37_18250, partial [Candidatus Lokiarchaeia archaeon]
MKKIEEKFCSRYPSIRNCRNLFSTKFQNLSLTSDQFINFELNDFAQYLKNELQIKLIVKLNLGKHYGPNIVQLIQEGYKEFVKGFYKKSIKYSAILSEINLRLKRVRRKDIAVKSLAEELKYLTQHLKEVLDLAPGEAPSLNQLVILGYRGFVVYLEKNNIDFNDVAIEAGLNYRNLQQSFLTYDDFLKLAMDKHFTFPLDREQFEERMKNRGRNISPSHVIFPWQCKKHGTWNTTYQTLKDAKYGCPKCYRESTRISYGDCVELAKTKDYEFAMDVYQFNKRIKDETI